jgi:hypothetical protein
MIKMTTVDEKVKADAMIVFGRKETYYIALEGDEIVYSYPIKRHKCETFEIPTGVACWDNVSG